MTNPRRLVAALMLCASPLIAQIDGWTEFRAHFVSAEGRVVDPANSGVSHSESQGYGLLFAAAANDRETFERILDWTTKNLAIRSDPLFAWRWKPGGGADDHNNATDGDLLIAWALKRGSDRWCVTEWRDRSRTIAGFVRSHLLRASEFGPLLLPGESGFERADGVIVNLSYWLFPAFREFTTIDPSPEWSALERSGLLLCERARFGDWQLPPDWLLIEKSTLSLPADFPPVFGYNAVRVPVHLWWAGHVTHPCVAACRRYFDLANATGTLAATINLRTGEAGQDPALPGMRRALALPVPAAMPGQEDPVYFSSSLRLLAALASHEQSRTPIR